jgi:hypothetical protein
MEKESQADYERLTTLLLKLEFEAAVLARQSRHWENLQTVGEELNDQLSSKE